MATAGGKSDATGTISVTAGAVSRVLIRNAANNGGSEVGNLNLTTDDVLVLYAAGYDAENNYIGDVTVSWSVTGTLDAVSPSSGSSTVFSPRTKGTSGTIVADHATATDDATGTISVSVGALAAIKIRDAGSGGGSEVGSLTITADQSLTVYAAGYDADGNFISDQSVTWSSSGLTPAVSGTGTSKSFSPTRTGSGYISADAGGGRTDDTGTITVTAGALASLIIRDASAGAGSEVGNRTMTTNDALTLYPAGYDADGNYRGEENATWSSTGSLTPPASGTGTSFTFSPTAPGSGTITATVGGVSDATGTITVNAGTVSKVLIRNAPNNGGGEVGNLSLTTDDVLVLYAAGYDALNNYVGDVTVSWSVTGTLDAVSPSSGSSTVFSPRTKGTSGTIVADHATATDDATGTISVSVGALAAIKIRDAGSGGGSEVGSLTITADQSLTVYAAGYDADGNFISDQSVTWSSSGLTPAVSGTGTSKIFSPTQTGSGFISADAGGGRTDATGTITVIPGALASLKIRDAAGGSGSEVGNRTMTTNDVLTLYAAGYDADGNYRGEESATWSSSGTLTPPVSGTGMSFTFDPTAAGSGTITATAGGKSDATGTITVNAGTVAQVTIRSAPNNGGLEVGNRTITTDSLLVLYAAGYDAENNYVGDITVTWTQTTTLGTLSPTTGTNTVFDPNTIGTTTIRADDGAGHFDVTGTITVNAGGLNSFAFTASIANQVAGQTFAITIEAKDAGGNRATSFNGSATLSDLTDTITPTSIAFTNGLGPANVTITKARTANTITVRSAGKSGVSNAFDVSPAGLDHFTFANIPSPQTAGTAFNITTTAKDAYENTTTAGYTNPVSLSDNTTTLTPTSVNFSAGQWTGNVTITKAQADVVITATGGGKSSQSNRFNVNAGALHHFVIGTISTQTAGQPFTIVVTAQDVNNNTATSFGGTVTISDLTGTISPTTSGAFGSGQWTGQVTITQVRTGDRITVTRTGGTETGQSNPFDVSPPTTVDHFVINPIASPQTAGTPFTITVTAKDANNNTVTSYTGTVTISDWSGSISPTLSGNFTNGVLTDQPVTITKTRTQNTITVTGAGKVGTSNPFDVAPAALARFVFDPISSPQTAGAAFSVTITAKDAYDNTATNFTTTASLSDQTGTLSPSSTGNFNAGVWTGNLTITKAQNDVKITATRGSTSSQSNAFNVRPATVTKLRVRDGANGAGTEVGDRTLTLDQTLTLYAAGYDQFDNYSRDVRATWSKTGTLDPPSPSVGTFTVFDPSTPNTSGTIRADSTGLTGDATGTITVGTVASLKIRDRANGAGVEVSSRILTADDSLRLFAAGYDAAGNYVGDVQVNWSSTGLVPSVSGTQVTNVTFSPTQAPKTGSITATHAMAGQKTATITVNPGVPVGTIRLTANPTGIPANGTATSSITSDPVLDADGNVIAAGTQFTVSTTLGTIATADVNPGLAGIQVGADSQGKITFTLRAGTVAGTAFVSANSVGGSAAGNTQVTIGSINIIAVSATPTRVSRGQSNVAVKMTVQNLGTAEITSLQPALKFTGPPPSNPPRNGDYDVTWINSGITLPGGTTRDLNFSVNVHSNANLGQVFIDGSVSGLANGATVADSSAPSPDSWVVQIAAVLNILRVETSPDMVTQGQRGISVTMIVENSGQATANISGEGLSFWRGAENVSTDYAVTASPTNPDSIPGGNQRTFMFTVNIGSGARTGNITIDGSITGTDANSGATISDTGAQTTDSWAVIESSTLRIVSLTPSQQTVTAGQTTRAWTVTMTVENTGGSNINIDFSSTKTYIKFLINGDVTSQYGIDYPTQLGGGDGVLEAHSSDVLVFRIRQTGTRTGAATITGRVEGTDALSGQTLAADAPATAYGTVTVQTPAQLTINQLIPSQPTATAGQTQDWTVKVVVTNSGQSSVTFDTANTDIRFDNPAGFVVRKPTKLNIAPGFTLGNATDTLTFRIDITGTTLGPNRIDAYLSVREDNSDRVITGNTLSGGHSSVTIQSGSEMVIENVRPSQSSVTRGQIRSWRVTVRVRSTGQSVLRGLFASSRLEFRVRGALKSDFQVNPPTKFEGSGGSQLVGGAVDSLVFTVVTTGFDTGAYRIDAVVFTTEVNTGLIKSDNTYDLGAGAVEVQTPPQVGYVAASLQPKEINRGSFATFTITLNNARGASTLILTPAETFFRFNDGVNSYEATLNELQGTAVPPGQTPLTFKAVRVPSQMNLGGYTPVVSLRGTENGNAYGPTNLTLDTNGLRVLEAAVLAIEATLPSQPTVTEGQLRPWTIAMVVANNGGASVTFDSAKVNFFIGAEVTSEYRLEYPTVFKNSGSRILAPASRDTLVFRVTQTGTTTGPVTIRGRVWATDNATLEKRFAETDGGTGSFVVQTAGRLTIESVTPSQPSVTRGQSEDWFIRVALKNAGGSDLVIDTSRTKTYVTLAAGTDFHVLPPESLSTGGLTLKGNSTAFLTFTVDSTGNLPVGPTRIDARVEGTEWNSGQTRSDSTMDHHWGELQIVPSSLVSIVSVTNKAVNAPYVNIRQPFALEVVVENVDGEGLHDIDIGLTSSGGSQFQQPVRLPKLASGARDTVKFPITASAQPNTAENFTARILQAISDNTGKGVPIGPSPDSTATAVIQEPAGLKVVEVVPSVRPVQAGQTAEWFIHVVVADTGGASLTLNPPSATDIVIEMDGEVQDDYILQAPLTLKHGGLRLPGGEHDTLEYRVSSTGRRRGGLATLRANVTAKDDNDGTSLSAHGIGEQQVETSVAVQLTRTYIVAPNTTPDGNASVNTGQNFELVAEVQNPSQSEGVVRVGLSLRTNGSSKIDTAVVIPEIPPQGTGKAHFAITAAGQESSGERFTVRLDSARAQGSGLPLDVHKFVPLDSLASVTIQRRATLALMASLSDEDGAVSTRQLFSVSAKVLNQGTAPVASSGGELAVSLPRGYRFWPDTTAGPEKTKPFVVGIPVEEFQVISPDTAQGTDSIRVRITGRPKDLNEDIEADVSVGEVARAVLTLQPGVTVLDAEIVSPEGARDGVVSTSQTFEVRVRFFASEDIEWIQSTLTPPSGYLSLSPRLQTVDRRLQGDSLRWQLRAPSSRDSAPRSIVVTHMARSSKGDTLKTIPSSTIVVRAVRRADLLVDAFVSSPPGASAGRLSVGQAFVISARVSNTGDAAVLDSARLRIDFGASGVTSLDSLTKSVKVGSEVAWNCLAPGTVTPTAVIDVRMTEPFPRDENTGLEAPRSLNGIDTLRVRTEEAGGALVNRVTLSWPEGAKDSVLSTDQEFTVEADITSSNVVDLLADLVLPSGFRFAVGQNQTQSVNVGTGVKRTWQVIAPSETVSNAELEVKLTGRDGSSGNSIASGPAKLTLQVVKRAEIVLSAAITDPPKATDNVVSASESFVITATVRDLGEAKLIGSDSLRLILPPGSGFTTSEPLGKRSVNRQVSWTVRAPSKATGGPGATVRVQLEEVPDDENTNADAAIRVGGGAAEIAVTVEERHLRVSRLSGAPLAVARGGTDIAMLGLKLESPGDSTANNLLLTQMDLTILNRQGQKIDPRQVITRIAVVNFTTPSVVYGQVGEANLLAANPIPVVFSRTDTIRPTSPEWLSIVVDVAGTASEANFQVAIDSSQSLHVIDEGSGQPVVIANENGVPMQRLSLLSEPAVVREASLEKSFRNFPNPFGTTQRGETTTFEYYLPEEAGVEIKLYTLLGELVWSRSIEAGKPGARQGMNNQVTWNAMNDNGVRVLNGVYIARITTSRGQSATTKVAVLK